MRTETVKRSEFMVYGGFLKTFTRRTAVLISAAAFDSAGVARFKMGTPAVSDYPHVLTYCRSSKHLVVSVGTLRCGKHLTLVRWVRVVFSRPD